MNNFYSRMGLHFCWRCDRMTYWHKRKCQRCLLIRQARIRGYLIAIICVAAFLAVVILKYWGHR